MGFKSLFTVASKELENGDEQLRLKARKSFVEVSRAQHVAAKRLRRKKISTEQLVPTKKGGQLNSCFSILKRNVLNDIHLRVLLLSAFSSNRAIPCEKSIIDACSQTGSVTIEMVGLGNQKTDDLLDIPTQIRLSGATNHHFRLYVTADEGGANIILPTEFRGVIHIKSATSQPIQFVCSAELRIRIEEGAVRLNAPEVGENEDEVFVYAGKAVQFQMEAEKMEEPRKGVQWILESGLSRFRRLLFMP